MGKLSILICLYGVLWVSSVTAQSFKVLINNDLFSELRSKSVGNGLKLALVGHQLPLIIIETGGKTIVNEPKITVRIKAIDNGPGKLNYVSDAGNNYDGLAGIEIHGQSSQMFPKKSYGIETRDSQGADFSVGLLGMPAESDWILYAPYSDKTMLRNAFTYSLSARTGRWQPRYRFCEVYLNGTYIGVYQLTEKIKRDKNRVNIAKLNPESISGNDLTGGYVFKVDKIADVPATDYFYSAPSVIFPNSRKYAFTYVYPKPEDIVTAQKNYLANTLVNFQNSLNGSSFKDLTAGYPRFIDIDSFVDFEIINELANNVDGYRYSTYFHKQKDSDGGKIVAGPVWDFDLSYGNVDYSPGSLSVTGWHYSGFGPGEGNCMHWWARLMQDPAYVTMIKNRWTQLRSGPLHRDSIEAVIDNHVKLLGDAVVRNFAAWPIIGVDIWPNYFVGPTYQSEVVYLKDWISRRITWIDSQWLVPTAVDELNIGKSFKVFPNPFRSNFTIGFNLNRPGDVRIELYNMAAVCVLEEEHKNQISGYQEILINTESFRKGVYILKVTYGGDKVFVRKILCNRGN